MNKQEEAIRLILALDGFNDEEGPDFITLAPKTREQLENALSENSENQKLAAAIKQPKN
jgi:hypothetical protein